MFLNSSALINLLIKSELPRSSKTLERVYSNKHKGIQRGGIFHIRANITNMNNQMISSIFIVHNVFSDAGKFTLIAAKQQ